MSAVSEIGRNFWLKGLTNVNKTLEGGLQQWVLDSEYTIDECPQKKLFKVRSNITGSIEKSFAFDISSLSCAAFETAHGIKTQSHQPLSSGWVLIQSYYAAYFAANALMRCFGYACSNMSVGHTANIRNMSGLFGFTVSGTKVLQAGLYLFEFNCTKNELHGRSLESIKGGVHAQFWYGFMEFTKELVKKIKTSPLPTNDKNEAIREIKNLQDLLSTAQSINGNWLSTVRNAVNYRLEYGGWYPYNNASMDANDILKEFNNSWKKDSNFKRSNFNGSDIVKFTFTCGLLVGWCRESMESIAKYQSHKSNFINKHTIAYLKGI